MLSVDILCPSEWRDGICDSYESRVYYDTKAESIDKAFEWANKQLKEINALDSIHGSLFYLHIEGHCVATIWKNKNSIERDEEALKLLNLYLTDKDAYFKALDEEIKKYVSIFDSLYKEEPKEFSLNDF